MGVYDIFEGAGKSGQVKLWDCEMNLYKMGDEVPEWKDEKFSIAMREGGYANITNRVFVSWTDKPAHKIVVDKVGNEFAGETLDGHC